MKRRSRADDSKLLPNSLDSISDSFSLPTSQDILTSADPFWYDSWHFNQSCKHNFFAVISYNFGVGFPLAYESMDSPAKQTGYYESLQTSEYTTLDQDLEELPFLHQYFMDPDYISKLENNCKVANGSPPSSTSSPQSTSCSTAELHANMVPSLLPNENSSMSLFNDKLKDLAKHSPKVTEIPLTLGMRHLLYQYQQTINAKDLSNVNQDLLDGEPYSYDQMETSSSRGIITLGADLISEIADSSHSEDVDDTDLDSHLCTIGQYSSPVQNSQISYLRVDGENAAMPISSELKGSEPSGHTRPSSIVRILIDNRPKRSKWTNYDRIGQEELYSALESVLQTLKSYTPHVTPFLVKVNKRDVPDYYTVIKKPMDIGGMTKKLKHLHYISKAEFIQDIEQIVSNAFAYNEEGSIYRVHAAKLAEKAKSLFSSIPDITIRSRTELQLEKEKEIQNMHHSERDELKLENDTIDGNEAKKEELLLHMVEEGSIQNDKSGRLVKLDISDTSNEQSKDSTRAALVASLFQEPFTDSDDFSSSMNDSVKMAHANVNNLLQIDALGQWLRWKRLLFREALMRTMCLGRNSISVKKYTGDPLTIHLQRVSDYMHIIPDSLTTSNNFFLRLGVSLPSSASIPSTKMISLERYLQQTWFNEFPKNCPSSLYLSHSYLHPFSIYAKVKNTKPNLKPISIDFQPSDNVKTFFCTLEDVQYCAKISAYLEDPANLIPPTRYPLELSSSLLSYYSTNSTFSKSSTVWLHRWTSWLCFYLGFELCSNDTLKTFASLFAHIFEKVTCTLASYLDYYMRFHPQAMTLSARLLLRDSGQNQFSKLTTSGIASVAPELGALQVLITYQHWFYEIYPRKIKENKRLLEKQLNYYSQSNPCIDGKEPNANQSSSQSLDHQTKSKEGTNDSISFAFLTGQLRPQDDLGLDWLGLKELGLGDISIPSHLFNPGNAADLSNSQDHLFEKEWAGVDPSSDLDVVNPHSNLKENSVIINDMEDDIPTFPNISHSYIDFDELAGVDSSTGNDFPLLPDTQMDADSNSVDSPSPPPNIPFLLKGSIPSSSELSEPPPSFLACTLPPLEKASTCPKLIPLVQPYYSNILFHDDNTNVIDESQCLLFKT